MAKSWKELKTERTKNTVGKTWEEIKAERQKNSTTKTWEDIKRERGYVEPKKENAQNIPATSMSQSEPAVTPPVGIGAAAGAFLATATINAAARDGLKQKEEQERYYSEETANRLKADIETAKQELSYSGGRREYEEKLRKAKETYAEWERGKYEYDMATALGRMESEQRSALNTLIDYDELRRAQAGAGEMAGGAAWGEKDIALAQSAQAATELLRQAGWDTKKIKLYKEYLATQRNAQNAAREKYQTKKFAEQHPVIASALSVAEAPIKAIGNVEAVKGVLPAVLGGYQSEYKPTDINSPWFAPSRSSAEIRGTVTDNINNPVGKLLYEAGMSALDSAVNMAIAGGVGLAGGATAEAAKQLTSKTMSLVMGSQVAADTVIDEIQKGHGNEKALALGIVRAVLEGVTEKYSVDAILKDPKTILGGLSKAFAAEGTEEVAANWLNRIVDIIADGDQAAIFTEARQYMERGDDEYTALAKAIVGEDAKAFLAGGVSGLGMTGISYGLGVSRPIGRDSKKAAQIMEQLKKLEEESETANTAETPAVETEEIPKMELTGPEAFEPASKPEQQPTEEIPKMELAGIEETAPAAKAQSEEIPKMELAGEEAFETKGEVNNAEISDRGRERDAGIDSRGQAERVYPERSGQAGLAAARADKAKAYVGVSPREYGVEHGSEEADMKIIPAEDYDGELKSISKALEGLGVKNHHFVVGGIKVKDPVSRETRSVNAVYNDATGTMIVRADSRLYTARQLALHETFHHFAAQNAELRDEAYRRLSAEMEAEELNDLIARYQVTYGNVYGDDVDAYIDEILADAYSGINRSGLGADRYSKPVRSAVEGMRNRPETQRQQTNGPNQRYSIKNTSQMTLEKQLNAYYNNKMASSDAFYFGETPEILKESGIDSLPLAMRTTDFRKSTKEKHNIPRRVIKNLLAKLQKPLFSFGNDNKVGVVIDDIDGDGKKVLVGIEKNSVMDRNLVNTINSIYGLDHPKEWISNQLESGKEFVLYDIEKANTYLQTYGYLASVEDGIRSMEKTIPQDLSQVKQHFSMDDEEDIRAEAFEAELERTELETALNQDVIDQVDADRIKEIERKAREKVEKQGLNALKSARRRLGAELRELTEGVDEPTEEQRKKYREKKAELAVYSEAVKAREAELSEAAEKKAAREKVTPRRAIREVRKELMMEFSTASENRREMGDIIEWYANKALEAGKLTRKGRNALFDRLTAAGLFKEAADQYYEQIYRALKKSKIYVPQDVINALGRSEWDRLRKTAFACNIILTKDPEATHIDVLARDMESIFGVEFADDPDKAYQLSTIVEYADEGRGENITFAERLARIESRYGIEEAEAYVERMQEKIDFAFEKFAEKAGIEIEYAKKQKETQALKTTVSTDARNRLRDNYEQKHKEEQAKHIAHEEYLRQKYNDEVEAERLEHRIQEYEQRKEHKFQLEAERVKHIAHEERQRREYQDKLADEKERHRQILRRAAERREASELRQKTLRSLHRLKSLQQKQGSAEWNAKVDAEMQRLTGVTLDDINTFTQSVAKETNYSKKYEATWGDLANMYREAKANDPNFIPSKDLEEIVHRLDGLSIKSLDVDALQDIFTAAAQLRQEFYDAKHLRIGNEDMAISEAFDEIVDEIKQSGEKARKLGAIDGLYNWEQLTPMSIFERMGGWNKNSLWYKFAQTLESGERKAKEYKVKSEAMLEEFIRNNQEWIKRADGQGKDAIWYEKTAYTITNPDPLRALKLGEELTKGQEYTIYMTPMMKIHMYLESKNYDNLRHMAGGRVFPDKKLYSQGKRTEAFEQKGTTVRLEPEQVRALCSDLTQQERELADILERYYNGYASEEINKVSNILYGYDKAATKNYAPIFVATNYTGTSWEVNDNATVEGIGRMKERIQSALPSYSISAIDAFGKHVTDTARWVGLAIPTHNMNKLLNWQIKSANGLISLKDTITKSFGKTGFNAVRGIMKNIASPAWNENSDIDSVLEKLTSQYISSTFAFNPSVVLKQVGSMWTAASELGFRNMVLGTFSRSDSKLIEKYTPELAYRMLGYATPELKYLREHPNKLDTSKVGKFLLRGGAITWMDGMAAKALWPAAVRYVKENYSDLEIGDAAAVNAGTSPFYQKVAEVFNDAITRTQSMSDAMHSALITKKGPSSKALTMFKTDSMQTYNIVRRNWGEMRYWQEESKRLEAAAQKDQNLAAAAENAKTEAKAATKKMRRTITAVLCSNLYVGAVSFLVALLKNGAKYYRDEDDELTFESVAAEFAKNIAQNAAGIFVLGEEVVDIADRTVQAFKGEAQFWSYDLVSSLTFDQINALAESVIDLSSGVGQFIANAINVAKEGGDIEAYFKRHGGDLLGIIESGLETVGVITGMPVKNFRDYVLGTLGTIAPAAKVTYEDATNIPTKADLTGTGASGAPLRVEHIYSARGVELSEAASAELARLYQAGYKEAVISNTPGKLDIKSVEFDLTASQQQTYDRAAAEIINAELENVLDSEVYAMASDEQKEKIINRLYQYAKETGKWETAKVIYQAADPDTRTDIGEYEQTTNQIKCNALREAGIPLVYFFGMQVLGDENDNNNLAQDEAEKWLRTVALEKTRKAAVWQAHSKQWTPKKNPFHKTTGKTIYQKLIEDAEALAD